jgi:hypothetical protein
MRGKEKAVPVKFIFGALVAGAAVVASSSASGNASAADNLIASRGPESDNKSSPPSQAPQEAAAKQLDGTPFMSQVNAAAMPALDQGRAVRRSIAEKTFTAEDRAAMGQLGFRAVHNGVVILHKIPKRNEKQVERVKSLIRSLAAFSPANACDSITSEGPGRGVCSGTTQGPIGKVAVRMPVQATFAGDPKGGMHVTFSNPRPLEAKGLFSWMQLVAPDNLKLSIDMFPSEDGWLVYTRIGVSMRDHAESAKTITDTLEKIDAWLMKDLARI